MRVALDTNVLVSAVATRGLCADVLHITLAEHQLIVGATVLSELRGVLRRKIRVPVDTIRELEDLLRREAMVIDKAPKVAVRLRDKADLAVLAEAVAGTADVLVTGDRDLLEIAGEAPIAILTPREFWKRLRFNAT